ncbi:MAG: VCBS repeat-containing protein [Cyclobacteriaceae bacterium]
MLTNTRQKYGLRFGLTFLMGMTALLSSAQKFSHIETQSGLDNLFDINCVAVADFDNDDDLDVFAVVRHYFDKENEETHKLFSNNGDGTFSDITKEARIFNTLDYTGLDSKKYVGTRTGASWVDYDNDGFPDLFLTNLYYLELLHNNGDGTFTDITEQSGFTTNECYNSGATWFDYNNDGFLDVYIVKMGDCDANLFYKNNGDGTFSDVTEEMGVSGSKTFSWSSIPIDANEDGWMDLYVANDFGNHNELFINQVGTGFIEEGEKYNVQGNFDSMGLTVGDFNNDGHFDIYVTNINRGSLYQGNGVDSFTNRAEELKVLNSAWSWGTQFLDYDHDGDEDLTVASGWNQEWHNFLFENPIDEGTEEFINKTEEVNLQGETWSHGFTSFDYDNDGDLDMIFSNVGKQAYFFENDASQKNEANDKNWLRINFEGTSSNRDGIGAIVKLSSGSVELHKFYHGTAGYLSQSLNGVHFGLGSISTIDKVHIKWPSGIQDTFENLSPNMIINAVEGSGYTILDNEASKTPGCTDPKSCNYSPTATLDDGSCQYLETFTITGPSISGNLQTVTYQYPKTEGSEYEWVVDNGTILNGQNSESVTIKWGIGTQASISVREVNGCYSENVEKTVELVKSELPENVSVARLWNEALLEAIRKDYARPTIHARNLFHTSIAMYDSWAIYDETAETYLLGKTVKNYFNQFDGFNTTVETNEARQMTISFAAYRLLSYRFKDSPNAEASLSLFDDIMDYLGYNKNLSSTSYSTGDPATLGNFIAASIIDYGKIDGANESAKYSNIHYQPVNPSLVPILGGNTLLQDPNRWQPLTLDIFIDQSGNPREGTTPDFLSPEWGNVHPFSLIPEQLSSFEREGNTYNVYFDPGQPPLLDTLNDNEISELYRWNFSLVSIWSAQLDPEDGVMWDISPASLGNIKLDELPKQLANHTDFYDLINGGSLINEGRNLNPVSGSPYPPQVVPRGDFARVLAEFWADGPDSETPPGHWFVLLNHVSDHPEFEARLEGKGEVLEPLEWDIKSYFALGGAMHDAAISAWGIKGWYDYIRPISAIRYMAERGQSSDPDKANYDVAGIPLTPGYIEMIEDGDELAGLNNENVGKIKLYAWKGHSSISNTLSDKAGVGWILAENWWPYQRPSFVTPPFAGYVSGHSTYSRAAAEVMTLLTGSEYFPGGVGEFIAKKNEFLVFEDGPSQDIVLQWATYQDASDQCSLSRIWGGIHPPADDIPGRLIGYEIGIGAFKHAKTYFEGSNTLANVANSGTPDIYPNPIIQQKKLIVTHTSSNDRFVVYNLNGKPVKIQEMSYNQDKRQTTLKFANLAKGIYLLVGQAGSTKFIVQ